MVEAGGGSVTWLGPQNYDNLGPDAAKLIDTAVSQGADRVIGPDWVPEAEDAAFKKVVEKGVPLCDLQRRRASRRRTNVGALNYIGSDDHARVKAGGEYLGEQGAEERPVREHRAGRGEHRGALRRHRRRRRGRAAAKAKQLPLPSSNFGNPTAVVAGASRRRC